MIFEKSGRIMNQNNAGNKFLTLSDHSGKSLTNPSLQTSSITRRAGHSEQIHCNRICRSWGSAPPIQLILPVPDTSPTHPQLTRPSASQFSSIVFLEGCLTSAEQYTSFYPSSTYTYVYVCV